eukprot:gene31020-7114_t
MADLQRSTAAMTAGVQRSTATLSELATKWDKALGGFQGHIKKTATALESELVQAVRGQLDDSRVLGLSYNWQEQNKTRLLDIWDADVLDGHSAKDADALKLMEFKGLPVMAALGGSVFPEDGAGDLFEPVAGLNDPGVMRSFFNALRHIRAAAAAALPGDSQDDLCYNFHTGTALLVALLDGIAVYVEKKIQDPPADGDVYWDRDRTFLDPMFAELRAIKERTTEYIIKGGVTANTLRNFAKHYIPWLRLSDNTYGHWDISFPVNATTRTGPVLRGLLFPLFNDACDACDALGRMLNQAPEAIERL